MASVESSWAPIKDGNGDLSPEIRQGMVANQLGEIKANKRAKTIAGWLKAGGFTVALGAGLASLIAGVLVPPLVPAAAVTSLAAVEAVSNGVWPVGLGVFGVAKFKEWINEFSRKKLLAQSTSSLFRIPKKAPQAA